MQGFKKVTVAAAVGLTAVLALSAERLSHGTVAGFRDRLRALTKES